MVAIEYELTEQQLAVIDDLFTVDTDEQTLLTKHNVTADTYYQWLGEKYFCNCLNYRLFAFNIQVEMMFARRAPQAAAKMISLLDCPNNNIALRACRDIINVPILKKDYELEDANASGYQDPPMSDEAAEKILEILVEDQEKQNPPDQS